MFDVKDGANTEYRRVEVLTGPGRRRRWSTEEKARVVSESLAPGTGPSEVARRWQICPQQVFAWRRQARAGLLVLPSELAVATLSEPAFVPIVTAPVPPSAALSLSSAAPAPSTPASSAIEIEIAGAVVRVAPGLDGALLTTVLRAVRASSAAP